MVAARDSDFLGDGTVDPFTGLAPAMTPGDEQAELDARRAQMRASATRTANTNNATGGYLDKRDPTRRSFGTMSAADLKRLHDSGDPSVSQQMVDAAVQAEKLNHEAMNSGAYKALTYGVLAAPAAITGGALAFGGPEALGFGGGASSLTGAEPIVHVANEAGMIAPSAPAMPTGFGATSSPFTMASPSVAGAAPSAAAATPSLPGMIGADLGKYAPGLAMAAAPYAINSLTSGKTREEKALLAKQEQLAHEAKVRQGQQQDARMNQLGQQLLAFNPSNQLMAKMYGPDAAYSPEQMANMVQGQKPPDADPSLVNYQGTDPKKRAEVQEWIRRKKEFDAAEAQRREMMLNGIQQPGPGPAPIQMATPQAARRY